MLKARLLLKCKAIVQSKMTATYIATSKAKAWCQKLASKKRKAIPKGEIPVYSS
jgi:hypothetical protein